MARTESGDKRRSLDRRSAHNAGHNVTTSSMVGILPSVSVSWKGSPRRTTFAQATCRLLVTMHSAITNVDVADVKFPDRLSLRGRGAGRGCRLSGGSGADKRLGSLPNGANARLVPKVVGFVCGTVGVVVVECGFIEVNARIVDVTTKRCDFEGCCLINRLRRSGGRFGRRGVAGGWHDRRWSGRRWRRSGSWRGRCTG